MKYATFSLAVLLALLTIAYEYIFPERAKALGRKPELILKAGLWTDMILELEPTKPMGANIVWEWHMVDHSIQDFDSTLDNFGALAEHPELVNINSFSVNTMRAGFRKICLVATICLFSITEDRTYNETFPQFMN